MIQLTIPSVHGPELAHCVVVVVLPLLPDCVSSREAIGAKYGVILSVPMRKRCLWDVSCSATQHDFWH